MSKREQIGLKKEIRILKKLDHPNIVNMFDHYEDPDHTLIVMEYIPGGELFKQLEQKDRYTEKDSRRIIRTLTEALKYCSDRGVVHRDLKPENILLRDPEGDDIVLCDFGFAFNLEPELQGFELLQTMCGTASYVAPEVILGRPYSYKCDIWSLGVIAYILLSGGYTVFSGPQQEILNKVKRGKWQFIPKKAWARVSPEAKDLISNILVKNAEKRFDYEQILDHPWIKQDMDDKGDAVDLTQLKKLNIQRKLYAAAKFAQAGSVFQEIMIGSESLLFPNHTTSAKEIGADAGTETETEAVGNSEDMPPPKTLPKGKSNAMASLFAKPDPVNQSAGVFMDIAEFSSDEENGGEEELEEEVENEVEVEEETRVLMDASTTALASHVVLTADDNAGVLSPDISNMAVVGGDQDPDDEDEEEDTE